jgi:ribosome-binding ATPase YchF (GTP1/OBG family)
VHVSGRVDPLADIETILTELALADLAAVERTLNRDSKKARSGDKDAQKWSAFSNVCCRTSTKAGRRAR